MTNDLPPQALRDRIAHLFPARLAPHPDVTSDDDGYPERGIDTRAASVVALVALCSIVLATFLLWRARPHATDAGPVPAADVVATAGPVTHTFTETAFGATPSPTPIPAPELVVDVQGTVRRPGVVLLPPGARVRDALAAAGGPRTGVSTRSLNLAAPVADGDQIVLGPPCGTDATAGAPMQAAAAPSATGARPAPATAPAPLDLNKATAADLEALPGVGPVLARRILEYRNAHGRFTSVEELREVSGIGPAKYAEIRSRVRV